MPKYILTLGAGAVGTILAIAGIYNNFISFLSFLSVLIPPVGGIYAADYFMNQKSYNFDNIDRIKNVRWTSLINWGLSSLVAFLTTPAPVGIGAFNITGTSGLDSFVVAFIIQIAINKFWVKNSILEEEK